MFFADVPRRFLLLLQESSSKYRSLFYRGWYRRSICVCLFASVLKVKNAWSITYVQVLSWKVRGLKISQKVTKSKELILSRNASSFSVTQWGNWKFIIFKCNVVLFPCIYITITLQYLTPTFDMVFLFSNCRSNVFRPQFLAIIRELVGFSMCISYVST
jgi:hypothetical protein